MNICMFADAQSVHVRRIALGLSKRGVEVHIRTKKPAEVPGAIVERFSIPDAGLLNPFRWSTRWRRYLREHMRRFDVVQVHFLADWGFTPEIIDEGCFVATPWGSDIVPPPGEGAPEDELVAARKMMLRQAAAITAWGPRFAGQVGDFASIDAREVALLPLGVEPDLFCPKGSAGSPARSADRPTVGFFKGFREVYGAIYLIRAMPAVLAACPQARFHLIGEGPELSRCRQAADDLGIGGRIQWSPFTEHERLPAIIQEWSLSAIPSLCESFGAAALESSAVEVPVVASDVGGLPDTVRDGETGLLVPPGQPDALADAIRSLLQDERWREQMGRAGREIVVREFDWNRILDKWVETFLAALDRRCSAA